MSRSEDISRSFYAQLGADGLANRTRPDWDAKIVRGHTEPALSPGRAESPSHLREGGRAAVPFERTWAGRQRLFVHLDKLE